MALENALKITALINLQTIFDEANNDCPYATKKQVYIVDDRKERFRSTMKWLEGLIDEGE